MLKFDREEEIKGLVKSMLKDFFSFIFSRLFDINQSNAPI